MKPGAARKLDIVLRSATGLKKVHTSGTSAYVVAWMEPSLRVPSPLDKRHGRNPEWNTTISITLDDRTLNRAGQRLHIELLGQGLVSTKPIGFVTVDLTDILQQASQGAAVRAPFLDHPVRRRSGRQQGILNFELCLQASKSTHTSSSAMQQQHQEVSTSSWSSSSSSSPPPQQQYNKNASESANMASAPPPVHYFARESVRKETEKSSSSSPPWLSRPSFGFAMPLATSKSRGHTSEQDEISLLHSSY